MERIRADRRRASVRVADLLAVIEERLLDPDLDVKTLLRAAGQRDQNVLTRFAAEMGLAPWAYILEARMELGGRMLVASTFTVWRVGVQVGYLSPGSFSRAFKKWSGKTPGVFRKTADSPPAGEPPPVPDDLVSRHDVRRAIAGRLPAEQAEALAGQLFSLGDLVCAGYRQVNRPEGGAATVESTMARNLWKWIEDLPYEVQMRAVESQAPRYQTLVLFNRLCTVAVEAEDGLRAFKLATLALAALHALDDRVGEDYVSVFARAYGVLGQALRRAGYLERADQELTRAMGLLAQAGDEVHPVIVAEVSLYRAALEIELGNVEEAERLSTGGKALLGMVVDLVLGPEEEEPEEAAEE